MASGGGRPSRRRAKELLRWLPAGVCVCTVGGGCGVVVGWFVGCSVRSGLNIN